MNQALYAHMNNKRKRKKKGEKKKKEIEIKGFWLVSRKFMQLLLFQ
jgi:hypothetical protein